MAMKPVTPSSSPSGRADEVRVGVGHEVGVALRDPGAEDAAVGHAVQRLDALVAGAGRVGEGVQPHLEAHAHVAEQEVRHERCRRSPGRRR